MDRGLFEAAFLGIDWPEEFGGRRDAHPLEAFIVAEEIARARTWRPIGIWALAAGALIEFGTDEQRRYFLPRMRTCKHVWCQLFSEPGAGSDLASLQTKARQDGEDFIITGQKVWTTNGQYADMGYLLARTSTDAPKHKGITAFALDMRSPGVDVRPLREITGTTDFNEVFLDDVRVPAANVIGAVNEGWRVATHSLVHERANVAAYGMDLFAALDDALELADIQQHDGRPALADSAIRQQLGDLATRVYVNAAMVNMSKSRVMHGTESAGDAPIGKIFFSETNLALAEFGVAVQGVDGVLTEADPSVAASGWWQYALSVRPCLHNRLRANGGASDRLIRLSARSGCHGHRRA